MLFYFNPADASHSAPDAETFYFEEESMWYWFAVPDGECVGPFDSEALAIEDAQQTYGLLKSAGA